MTKQTLKICLTTVQSLLVDDDDDDVLFKLILGENKHSSPITFCLQVLLRRCLKCIGGGLLILQAI